MSPATLPRIPALDLDFRRIAGTSATIAIHLAALMLLLAPVQWSPPAEKPDEVDTIRFEEIKVKPIDPPPPITIHQIDRTRHPDPRPVTIPEVMPQLDNAPIDEVLPTDGVVADETGGDVGEIGPPPSGPQVLQVLVGPTPTYPMQAIRQGLEGKVMLRIEVDANGVPVDGRIESSSGESLLDRAALKFVLAKWRFKPATYNGQAIPATVLVPVDYVLNR